MINASPLGKVVPYVEHYEPTLLYPIPRALGRASIGLHAEEDLLPFIGVDQWTGYELSWLQSDGKPAVATATFSFPCVSPFLIESKSLKLYLNSFHQTVIPDADEVRARLIADLSAAAGAPVEVTLYPVTGTTAQQHQADAATSSHDFFANSVCIDACDTSQLTLRYDGPHAHVLRLTPYDRGSPHAPMVQETLISHLLKSNCPVTGQPDWATLRVAYRGLPIDHAGLLAYVISFRQHQGFHEQCVEQIFLDLWSQCAPLELSVVARYTRRGGLDINPYRASPGSAPLPPAGRCPRQ